MKYDRGRTTSVWMQPEERPVRPALLDNITADVCVVGAGIAGLTTAYLLARERQAVVVLDRAPVVGGGETSRTTAHLTTALDVRYSDLERLHGERAARLAAQSHGAAIERIAATVAGEGIACEFDRLDGFLFEPPGEASGVLDQELQAAHRAGLTGVEFMERAPLSHFHTGPCLRFPRQAQFHPLKYVDALARAIEANGGRIFTDTHAETFDAGPPGRVATSRGPVVTANAIVVATNTPVNNSIRIHTKQAAYRTYVIGARVPRGSVTRALYWDTANPFHYARLRNAGDHDVLIVGGEDHKTGQDGDIGDRFNRLEGWTRERFPMTETIAFRWSGQVVESVDGLAFIGRNAGAEPNLYVATGDSGNGMTHGVIAGILLTDLIMGRENEWRSLYDPSRIRFGAAAEFARENLNVAAQFRDYLPGGERHSPEEIGPGEGAILQIGLAKIAVSRDTTGVVRQLSAHCPHLGCLVRWNPTEATWDCPCHGSRFTSCGEVINGPATTGLEPL